ncbi:MAG TPA: ABC transporter ATP-binding protein [Acidimicrobiales bacterium]|nr:ABC transporter ATP-binding protein [Acidimicrobiales bacterium]
MAAVIHCERLTKRYGAVDALHELDLDVHDGEVLGFLGPNGAGKTTTIRLLLGLIRPTAGRAELFGLHAERDAVEIHKRVAFVPGEAAMWPTLTGEEILHLLANVHGSVDEPYRRELIDRFDFDPTKKARAYSKGNRQKIVLIAAFASRADLLIMDEPTIGLDPLMEQEFRAAMRDAKDRGQTVFLSSHILSEVEAVADRVAILRAGRLVESGSIDELRIASAVTVEIKFSGRPPALAKVKGVRDVSVDGKSVRCQIAGPIQPLLDALDGHQVVSMFSREPSLEELFLAHYGREPAQS